ncbi:conserved Plasmodium protein, unknown function [Plasmodium malariae]|uniref:Uncharacterized protein n=1 Tax=Plasmodium malariae TaxID=5858 RepID=A0A1C3KC97_PLAMA|nr:conserved Plasmodium protein, unknown function [Plasmodium malariae]
MKRILNYYVLIILYYFENVVSGSSAVGKLTNVIYTNENTNNTTSELSKFQYIFLNENEDSNYINSLHIGEIKLKEEIYFYKSFTKIINYFKYRVPANVHFVFEYDGGDIILLKNYKNGVICEINNLFYSESGLKYFDMKKELYVKSENFYIKRFDASEYDEDSKGSKDNDKNDDNSGYNNGDDNRDNSSHNIRYNSSDNNSDLVPMAAICKIKNNKFLPEKLLCYPSAHDHNEINAIFIKNEEYKNLLELAFPYMNKENTSLLKKISNYFKSFVRNDFENINIAYYVFNKTIACNLKVLLEKNANNYIEGNQKETKLSRYNDEKIANSKSFLFNSPLYRNRFGDNYILWKHINKNMTNMNFDVCNKIYLNENDYNNCYKNLQNMYEMLLYKNPIMDIFNKSKIKNISSVNRYTAFYYNNNDYVIILKDYKFHVYFKVKNIIDFVLFVDSNNEIGFYYITLSKNKQLVHLYRCSLNSNEVKCKQVSFIPYETISHEQPKIYLSTTQMRDISTVFISTRTKIWKVYKEKDGMYNRKIIDSIKNIYEEYFGHINCYIIQTTYERELLYKYFKNVSNTVENIAGCSYIKHFNNFENKLLISFIENNQFIQRTYHIIKNVNFIISSGKTKLTIKVNELFDILMMVIIIFCVLLSVYTIFKILFVNFTSTIDR